MKNTKVKFNPESLNGTHKLKNSEGKTDLITVQWYEGCGSYYFIINNNASMQGGMSVAHMKKLLKKYKISE
jgi:hypothetical protein